MSGDADENGTTIMKIVEAIAITPQDAREVVHQYEAHARATNPRATAASIRKHVTDKIIRRYSRMTAFSGGATSLTGVVPGLGTAIAMAGGGLADISICMKLQVDMTMCLAIAINDKLTNEDAKHMSFVVALAGSLEKFGSEAAKKTTSKAAVNIVSRYLKGATLQTIRQLFKLVGIKFTQRAAIKAIPFGAGVVIGATANYYLTQYVGKIARDVFLLETEETAVS